MARRAHWDWNLIQPGDDISAPGLLGPHAVGMDLVGWGLFNLVEGLVNHQILGIHHVKAGDNQTLWDIAFLAFGALLVVGGYLLQRRGEEESSKAEPVDAGALT